MTGSLPYRKSAQADPCRWPEPDADGRCRYCGWALTRVEAYMAPDGIVTGHYRHRRPRVRRLPGEYPASNPHEGGTRLSLSAATSADESSEPVPLSTNRTQQRQGAYPQQPSITLVITLMGRITPRTKRVGDCLLWTGSTARGYGQVHTKLTDPPRTFTVHRLAYIAAHGPIPDGLEVSHLCERRTCLEPRHLISESHAANMARLKGRKFGKRGGAGNRLPIPTRAEWSAWKARWA